MLLNDRLYQFFLSKKDQKRLWCHIYFQIICNFFWSNDFSIRCQTKDFLLVAGQFETILQEFRLWGSQLDGCLTSYSLLLQNSLLECLNPIRRQFWDRKIFSGPSGFCRSPNSLCMGFTFVIDFMGMKQTLISHLELRDQFYLFLILRNIFVYFYF